MLWGKLICINVRTTVLTQIICWYTGISEVKNHVKGRGLCGTHKGSEINVNTGGIFTQISNITIGQVVAFGAVVVSIITAASSAWVKVSKFIRKYNESKDEKTELEKTVKEHSVKIDNIEKLLGEVKTSMDEQKEREIKKLRHDLVSACESAINDGFITVSRLCSIEDMYDDYKNQFNKNGYTKTLMCKVRNLRIINNVEIDQTMENILAKGKKEMEETE